MACLARTLLSLSLIGSALLAWSCAAETETSSEGALDQGGGQTGSLFPPACGEDVLSRAAIEVPEGDAALIFSTETCGPGMTPKLVDSEGTPIGVVLEGTTNGGGHLIRTREALVTGEYQVVVPTPEGARSVPLIVSEASPLPTELGTLSQTSAAGQCDSPRFRLALTPEAMAYASLIQLSVGIDGAPPVVWVPFGQLAANEAQTSEVMLPVLACGEACQSKGSVSLVVTAEVAGEALALPPLKAGFDVSCPDLEVDENCSVTGVGRLPTGELTLSVLSLVFLFRRSWLRR